MKGNHFAGATGFMACAAVMIWSRSADAGMIALVLCVASCGVAAS